jgi:hypothetical protein
MGTPFFLSLLVHLLLLDSNPSVTGRNSLPQGAKYNRLHSRVKIKMYLSEGLKLGTKSGTGVARQFGGQIATDTFSLYIRLITRHN